MATSTLAVPRRVVARTVIAMAALLVMALPGPAGAGQISHDQYRFEFDVVESQFCGDMTFRIEGVYRGTFREMVKGDQHFYFMENIHGRREFTNLDTGLTVTSVSNWLNKDQRVIDNGDGTLTIYNSYTGHESLVGPEGRKPDTAAGSNSNVFVVDHAGTVSDPSDDVLISEEVVGFNGTGAGGDGCEIFRDLTSIQP